MPPFKKKNKYFTLDAVENYEKVITIGQNNNEKVTSK